jgi:hypothetical protein
LGHRIHRVNFRYFYVRVPLLLLLSSQRKLAALRYSRFFIRTYNRLDDDLVRLNLSTLQSRRIVPDALFIINISLKTNVVPRPFLLLLVYLHLPGQSEAFSTFNVRHRAKVSPSARCVPTANAVCRYEYIDSLNKEFILFTDIFKSVNDTSGSN